MAEAPNLNDLYCDPRKTEFTVEIDVRGTLRETVKADSPEAARAKVEAMLDANELELPGEDFERSDISYIRAGQPMYLVTRDGKPMGVSHPKAGDEPREPAGTWEVGKYFKPAAGGTHG